MGGEFEHEYRASSWLNHEEAVNGLAGTALADSPRAMEG